ncbi:MAG: T9SS type A sorting domain-containing protein, partial [Bacteroidales bacterium]|nr:T9SS type A sorting domain-containing protein [Bacteroidales bacterium]
VAVSENSDPTGTWYRYTFDTDPTNQVWFDYPNFGFNKHWIVVSGNMFGNGFYSAMFVLDKADLYNNESVVNYSRFEIYDGFTLVPAKTYDMEEEDIYCVNNAGGNNGGFGYLNLWRVTGGYGNEQIEDLGLIQLSDTWGNGSYANGGNFAPQLGSDLKINTVDARMENMIYRNGKLWTVHHVYLPVGNNPTRSAVQWFELALDGTVLQHGRVDDPDGNMYYAFASIAVNAKEDLMIGYNSYSEDQYASSSYSFRYGDDPPNTLRDSYQYKDGLAPYWKTFGGSRNRWGDYSGTVVDPVDDLDFWTLQEYADLPSSQDHWATWWAYIDIDAVPKADFTVNITSVPTGSGVNFTDLSKYGPTEWLWEFEGGTPSTSTDQHPQNIIYENSGLFNVTLIATNYLGSNTFVMEDFINSNTTILPEVQFLTSDTLPCIGEVVYFEDRTIYNPIEWMWEFYPDYVTFVNGTDENSQHPEVTFDLSVKYEVTFIATNLNGSSSVTKSDFIHSGGLHLPFMEDFESMTFNTKAWTIDNPDNDKTWEITTVSGNEPGSNAAFVNIKSYNGLNERDRLITPILNLSDYNEAHLEFQYAYAQRFPLYTDSLIVYLSADCGSALTRLVAFGEDSLNSFATAPPSTLSFKPLSPQDWCGVENNPDCVSIDITEWIGNPNVQIIFESYNGFGNNIYVDNVVLEGTLSNIEKNQAFSEKLSVYPNPAEGSFTIELIGMNGIVDIQILDISGQLMYTDKINCSGKSTAKQYSLNHLAKGIYLIQAINRSNVVSQKIIIK